MDRELEEARAIIQRFITAVHWWGQQEDGIPAEICGLYVEAKSMFGHEYSDGTEAQALMDCAYGGPVRF